jgi:hypothetical protein
MSFNKRFFNWESLLNSAATDSFEIFDRSILKVDAHISDSSLTGDFLKAYLNSETEARKLLKDLLLERESFIKDCLKFYFVIKDNKNEEKHGKGVTNFIDLFFSKWGDLAAKYKNII